MEEEVKLFKNTQSGIYKWLSLETGANLPAEWVEVSKDSVPSAEEVKETPKAPKTPKATKQVSLIDSEPVAGEGVTDIQNVEL